MNDFVNLKKRSISLPKGYKNLVDALRHPKHGGGDPIRRFIALLLMQAYQDHVAELVIGVAPEFGDTTVRCKILDIWRDMLAFPSDIRPRVIDDLGKLAALPESQFPKEGVIKTSQMKWRLRLAGPDAECILTSIDG